MKRILLAAVTSSALALVVPGLASAAHSSKCHHRAHHACSHSRHAQRARVLHFGVTTPSPGAGGATTTTGPSGAPRTTSTPTTPGSAGETAGTVTSFVNGVLTITLTDGSTVSGKVTEHTEIQCQPATPPTEATDPDEQGDESSGDEGGNGSSHGGPGLGSHGDDMSGGGPQQTGGEDDEGDQQGSDDGQQSCTTAALVAGAVVREAELSVGGSGAVWDRIDLIQ